MPIHVRYQSLNAAYMNTEPNSTSSLEDKSIQERLQQASGDKITFENIKTRDHAETMNVHPNRLALNAKQIDVIHLACTEPINENSPFDIKDIKRFAEDYNRYSGPNNHIILNLDISGLDYENNKTEIDNWVKKMNETIRSSLGTQNIQVVVTSANPDYDNKFGLKNLNTAFDNVLLARKENVQEVTAGIIEQIHSVNQEIDSEKSRLQSGSKNNSGSQAHSGLYFSNNQPHEIQALDQLKKENQQYAKDLKNPYQTRESVNNIVQKLETTAKNFSEKASSLPNLSDNFRQKFSSFCNYISSKLNFKKNAQKP